MTSKSGKPDFSNVQGGHSSRTEPAPAKKPDFGNVGGGFASTEAKREPGLMPVNTVTTAATHTVVKGESLSKISKKVYGNSKHWRLIFEANRDQIDNPDLIQIGWVLKIPPAPIKT